VRMCVAATMPRIQCAFQRLLGNKYSESVSVNSCVIDVNSMSCLHRMS